MSLDDEQVERKHTTRQRARSLFEDLENKARLRDYAIDEKKGLMRRGILPLHTSLSAVAHGLVPPGYEVYAVPEGTAVTTNRQQKPRHPISREGGFVMLSRGQIDSVLQDERFTKSAAAQAVFLSLLARINYGGDVDPAEESVAKLAQRLNLSRQQVNKARGLLYALDILRPRDSTLRAKCWVLNPVVAFAGDTSLHHAREQEFAALTPYSSAFKRVCSKKKGKTRGQRRKNSKSAKK